MITNLSEAAAKAAEMFINFSDFLKKDVVAFDGTYIGKVWDVSSKLGEVYPKADELIIYRGTANRLYASVLWALVGTVADEITLNIKKDDLKFSSGIGDR